MTRPTGIHSSLKSSRKGRKIVQNRTLRTRNTTPTTDTTASPATSSPAKAMSSSISTSKRRGILGREVRARGYAERLCQTLKTRRWTRCREAPAAPADETPIIHPKAPPIESRFLYVDVAALRAKQLRRGARPRLDQAEEPLPPVKVVKAERVAMEEVKQNLVQWDLPDFKVVVDLR